MVNEYSQIGILYNPVYGLKVMYFAFTVSSKNPIHPGGLETNIDEKSAYHSEAVIFSPVDTVDDYIPPMIDLKLLSVDHPIHENRNIYPKSKNGPLYSGINNGLKISNRAPRINRRG